MPTKAKTTTTIVIEKEPQVTQAKPKQATPKIDLDKLVEAAVLEHPPHGIRQPKAQSFICTECKAKSKDAKNLCFAEAVEA